LSAIERHQRQPACAQNEYKEPGSPALKLACLEARALARTGAPTCRRLPLALRLASPQSCCLRWP
jgi:hypothetical protein